MDYGALRGQALQVIGLTGGIGTGKTTVSNYLAHRYGLPILDADVYAREAVTQGSQGLQAIFKRYGPNIMQADGNLDRVGLAQILFQHPAEKQWIEGLIHPYVRQRFVEMQGALKDKSRIVMVIPLLFESSMIDLVSEVWVVFCRPEQQLNRLMQRSYLTQPEAQRRIDSQMSMAEKCARGDVVLDNSGSTAELYAQIDQVFQTMKGYF